MFRAHIWAVILVSLVGVFLFGSVVHAVVPHSHDGAESVWQELHAALRHEGKNVILVASSALWVVALLPIVISVRLALQPIGPDSFERQLHRGIAKYRRFD